MTNVEFLRLGDYSPESDAREFDAVSDNRFLWQGRIKFEQWSEEEPRLVVYSSRRDPLDHECAIRLGRREEVINAGLARAAITKAIISCFDHRITMEVLSDGNGGWIHLETDT